MMEARRNVEPVVVVLGFHRSGTSMVTRMLNLLGVDLGEERELLQPVELDNPRGYWEPRWIIDLNDEILAVLGTSAFEAFRVEPGWERSPALEPLRERARRLLDEHLAHRTRWGWKDPRTSLTLPFWRELVDAPLACVVCVRSPLDAVASALRRGLSGIEQAQYVDCWIDYTEHALANTAPAERMLLFYDDVLDDACREMRRIAAFLGLPSPSAEQLERIATSAESGLRHHSSSLSDIAIDGRFPVEARALFLLLRATRRLEDSVPAGAASGDLADLHDALERLTPALASAHRQGAVARARAAQLEEVERRLREREAELTQRDAQLAERDARLAQLDAELADRDARLAEREHAIATLVGSRSWRLTRPLRALGRVMRRGR